MAKTISVKMQVTADTKGIQQYNTAMKSAVTASKQAEGGVKQLTGAYDSLEKMLGAAVFGMSVTGVVDLGVKMYNQGYQVNTAAIAFRAYARAIGDADDMMKRLRAGTGNVVTDFDLMSVSAELMGLRIARSDDQLVEMVSNVAKLTSLKPGQSLAEGMDAFLRVMRNGATSFRMLDNIGISATRVKEILAVMGKPMSDQMAYGEAVLQAIREKLDEVGGAAERAYTPVNRLITRIENLYNTAASNVAIGVEGTLGLLEISAGQNPYQIAGRDAAQDWYMGFMSELNSVTPNAFYISKLTGMSDDGIGKAIEDAYSAWKNANDEIERSSVLFGLEMVQLGLSEETTTVINQVDEALVNLFEDMLKAEESTVLMQKLAESINSIGDTIGGGLSGFGRGMQSSKLYADMLAPILDTFERVGRSPSNWFMGAEHYAGMNNRAIDNVMPQYMSQSDADQFAAVAEQAMRDLEEAKAKLSADIITDEQYDMMKDIADVTKKFADEAQRAVDAFDKMKLSEMLGQTGGGRKGEWFGDILGLMGSGQDFAADKFALATGEENALSLLKRDTIDPFLANLAEIDPDMVVTVVTNMNAAMETMTKAGWTIDQKAAALINYFNGVVVPGATAAHGANLNTGGNTFTIKPGMSASEAAAAAGMSVDQLLQTYKWKDTHSIPTGTFPKPSMGGGIDALANIDPSLMMGLNQFAQSELPTAQPLADNLTTANTEVKPMQDVFATTEKHINNMVTKMNQLTSETQLVRIQFKVFGTEQWLQELLITKKIIVNAEFASGGGDSGGFGTTGLKSDSKTPLVPTE